MDDAIESALEMPEDEQRQAGEEQAQEDRKAHEEAAAATEAQIEDCNRRYYEL